MGLLFCDANHYVNVGFSQPKATQEASSSAGTSAPPVLAGSPGLAVVAGGAASVASPASKNGLNVVSPLEGVPNGGETENVGPVEVPSPASFP